MTQRQSDTNSALHTRLGRGSYARRADSGAHIPATEPQASPVARMLARIKAMPKARLELVASVRERIHSADFDLEPEFAKAMEIMARDEFGV